MLSEVIHELISINYERVRERIEEFIKREVRESGLNGVVLGLSGGIDSTTTLYLAKKALSPSRVLCLIMPDRESNPADVRDAVEIASMLGVDYKLIDITEAVEAIIKSCGGGETLNLVAKGNVKARVRMTILYYHANTLNRLVLGTGDKSELMLGYFTKYGDGGVDILPIGGLFKTQVRELARRIGVPEKIVGKPSSPGLWPGHYAESELGARYEVIDPILFLYEEKLTPSEISRRLGINVELVEKVISRVEKNIHKLRAPPICTLKPQDIKLES